MFQAIVLGWIRHALTVFGASMVTDGYLTEQDQNAAIGAIILLVSIGWSTWKEKRRIDQLPWRKK